MIDTLLQGAGEGAALTAPRPKSRVFGSWSALFHSRGRVIEVRVVLATPKRWRRMVDLGIYSDPDEWSILETPGVPLLVAVKLAE